MLKGMWKSSARVKSQRVAAVLKRINQDVVCCVELWREGGEGGCNSGFVAIQHSYNNVDVICIKSTICIGYTCRTYRDKTFSDHI